MKKIYLLILNVWVVAIVFSQNNSIGIAKKYLIHDKDMLSEKLKAIEKPFDDQPYRPTLDGEQTYHSNFFLFHYTTKQGHDSVPNIDENQTGIPDYVENMAAIFDSVYNTFVRNRFSPPPSDENVGGDSLYDIYVGNLDVVGTMVCGFVAPEKKVGNNNRSSMTETDAWTSFMCMRNDYSKFAGNEEILIKVTAAHEFMHAIQLGYSKSNMSLWFKEMTAVWAEDLAFPGLDDNLYYLKEFFLNFDIALNLSILQDANGKYYEHWYGTWLFAKYITEHTNDTIINNIFRRTLGYSDIIAIEDGLALYQTSFKEMLERFYIANVLLTDIQSAEPYTYKRGKVYYNYLKANKGGIGLDGEINYKGIEQKYYSNTNGNSRLMKLSADYINLKTTKPVNLTLIPATKNTDMQMMLLKINFNSGDFALQNIQKNTNNQYSTYIDSVSKYGTYLIIVKRFDKNYYSTTSLQYEINASEYPLSIEQKTTEKQKLNIYNIQNVIHVENNTNVSLNIIIANVSGNVLINKKMNKGINAYPLPKGIYFVVVSNNNGIVERKKVLL